MLTTIAILTAVGVDFSYSSRVSLKLAENLRDETRAYYLARSGVNLARLLLHFQKQVDQMGGALAQGLSSMLGGGQAPGQPPIAGQPPVPLAGQAMQAAGAPPASTLGVRLWEILPIDSNAFSALLSGSVEGLDKATPPDSETKPIPLAPGEKGAATTPSATSTAASTPRSSTRTAASTSRASTASAAGRSRP